MTSYIGYNNLVKSGTLMGYTTAGATGYEEENAQSWKTSSWWSTGSIGTSAYYIDMGAAVDIDSFGLAGHNLGDCGTTFLYVQYSATGLFAGEQVNFYTPASVTNNNVIFKKQASVSARYWAFLIVTTTDVAYVGNFFLGEALSLERGLPEGFSPANLNRDRKIFNNMSEGGNYLGRSLMRKGSKIDINQPKITRAWIDANWATLADSIELYPFYFVWDYENYPLETAYCMANNITYPAYSDTIYLDFNISCTALYDV